MQLASYSESLAYEIAFWMQALSNPKYPIGELGTISMDLSRKLRALAVIALSVSGECDGFHHNLIRSAITRTKYLERAMEVGGADEHHVASGRYEPMTDAIAAGALALARLVAQLSPREFRQSHEYEDDYCYAQIISRWISEPVLDAEAQLFIDRFAKYVGDKPNARLSVCSALALRDQPAFDEAFEGLLGIRDLEIEEAKARGQLEETHVIAQRRVFVEGLAILRLAEKRGLRTQAEYRYCPSLARKPMRTPFPGE
ncbi:MAG: Imm49 family immunity protein [Chthoniobacteraceae bacterium]